MNKLSLSVFLAMTLSFFAVAGGDKIPAESGPVITFTDGHRIVMALIANPEVGERLREEYLTEVGNMTGQQIQPGVTQYLIQVRTCGNCMPRSGTVTIIEDMRPTYMDGAIAYDVSFQIDERRQ